MKMFFEIIKIMLQAFAESDHSASSVDHDAKDRQIKHRAANGDISVSISHPMIWDAHKPHSA